MRHARGEIAIVSCGVLLSILVAVTAFESGSAKPGQDNPGQGNPGGGSSDGGSGGGKAFPAEMQDPEPGSLLTHSTVAFQWSSGQGVSEYELRVGTVEGGEDVFAQNLGTSTSVTVDSSNSFLPFAGVPFESEATIYVRLSSLIKKKWEHLDYAYPTKPPRINQIADWRTCYPSDETWAASAECPQYPGGWAVDDVIRIMQAYPGFFFFTGVFSSRPPGNTIWTAMGRHVDELQARALEVGLDRSRVVIDYRPDVFRKHPHGWHECGGDCGWQGRMDGSKGDAPFDTSWIMRVPAALHDQVVDDLWAGRDSFQGNNANWPPYVDRSELESLNTAEERVALYGSVALEDPEELDGRFVVTAVVMDLRIPEYRTWNVKLLLYKLEDFGISPGEPFTLLLTYKPGWHTWYEGPDSGDDCYLGTLSNGSSVNMWAGPAHVCAPGKAPGGPFHPTQYGPGEYEAAINAWLTELIETLEAEGHGDFWIYTTESPDYRGIKWLILSPETRKNRRLIGERWMSITPDAGNL